MVRVSSKDDERTKSIDLDEESEEEDGNANEVEAVEDEFEEGMRARLQVFANHSKDKDKIIAKLLQSFSKLTISFVEENEQSVVLVRCAQAAKSLKVIKQLVNEYDDPTSRLLSIFLCKSKMVSNNLAALIGISATDESCMKSITKVAFLLLRPITVSTKESLASNVRTKVKGKETTDEAHERAHNEKTLKSNAQDQLQALLSFKEAFSSEAFIKGLLLVAHKALERSKFKTTRTEDDAKTIELVLKVISYLLAVDASIGISSPAEMERAEDVHSDLLKKFQGPVFDLVISFCADMDSKENHDLLSIFIDILSNIIRGFRAEDLFDVWRHGKVVSFADSPEMPVIPDNALDAVNKISPRDKQDKLLRNLLQAEQLNSLKVSSSSSRRFHGVFRTNEAGLLADSRIVKNPFQANHAVEADVKRGRKAMLFALDDGKDRARHLRKEDRVLTAVANFIDRLIDSGGYSQVVFRVKEHLRRGDSSIGNEEEECFYLIASFCLKYYRLKTEFELTEQATATSWVPRLQYIMLSLDRMSFHHVTQNMKSYLEGKKYSKVHTVLETYTEMLSYVLLLMSSSDTCHHELAAAALFLLFFRSTDRLDPLPQLMRDWKPSLFDRKYLNSLVELAHQTMKVLDKAKLLFSGRDARTKHSKKSQKKNDEVSDNYEVAVEQYIASVLTFDVHEYFKRIVSNHSVRMYTRLLEKFESNPPKVNHYIYSFFNRMLAFKLDSHSLYPDASERIATEHDVSLGFLLFNMHTLVAFNSVLSNAGFIGVNKYMAPMVDLIKSVVRSYFTLAEKNRLLYVESMFQHPHAIDFVEKLDSVYEAASFGLASSAPAESTSVRNPKRYDSDTDEDDDEDAGQAQKPSLGDEFDEANLTTVFARKEKVALAGSKRNREGKKLKKRKDRDAWTKEEDAILREQYNLYKGSRSIFETIAACLDLRSLKPKLNARAIEKRVKELELYMDTGASDDEAEDAVAPSKTHDDEEEVEREEGQVADENGSEQAASEAEAEQSRPVVREEPVRKARKSAAGVWENLSDDDEKWSGRRASTESKASTQPKKLNKRKADDDSDGDDDLAWNNEDEGDLSAAAAVKASVIRRGLINDDDDE